MVMARGDVKCAMLHVEDYAAVVASFAKDPCESFKVRTCGDQGYRVIKDMAGRQAGIPVLQSLAPNVTCPQCDLIWLASRIKRHTCHWHLQLAWRELYMLPQPETCRNTPTFTHA